MQLRQIRRSLTRPFGSSLKSSFKNRCQKWR
ncbi:hypothetical protein FOMG_18748 [Fusarium oxysporum f. sp. melonis 26406]|uniref:Uncharacterized protein n=1 Tax=Fusarium oxysporum f. sp. melonis 26406 TaxID=1089452 RepID=W9ZTY7_FUSOX|nr:hypothetical protein FOMG_18748 [Fusarium oxysporum f. sp. melonis 26406]